MLEHLALPLDQRGLLAGILGELDLADAAGSIELLSGGSVNVVARVTRGSEPDLVVRFPKDRRRDNEFPVETWASDAARSVGVPVATAVASGHVDRVPYLVLEYVESTAATVADPWRRLGEYAQRLAEVRVDDAPDGLFSRFGRDLDHAWAAHVDYNLAQLVTDDSLLRDGAYGSHQTETLREAFARIASTSFTQGLAHGDLAPRNLIARGAPQQPVLIDWGNATTGPTPWTDAQRVFEWAVVDLAIDESDVTAFLSACGLASATCRRLLGDLTALHLVDVTRWAGDRRPDLYQDYVAQCRAGLAALRLTA